MAWQWLASLMRATDIQQPSAADLAPPYLFLKSERRFLYTSHDNVACRPLRLSYGGLHPPFTIHLRNPYATALPANDSTATYAALGPFEEDGQLEWTVVSPPSLWLQATIVDGKGLESSIPSLWVVKGTTRFVSDGICWDSSLITGDWVAEGFLYFLIAMLALLLGAIGMCCWEDASDRRTLRAKRLEREREGRKAKEAE